MMESITVLETNPMLFMQKFITSVQNGYFVENTNAGHVSDGILKEIVLYKDEDKEFEKKELGEFVISDYSAQNFLYELCSWVSQGAHLDINSLFWNITGVKSIRGKLYLPAEYTKEQLSELDWADFKEAVKTIGITGRDRNLMLTKYLQMTGQEV